MNNMQNYPLFAWRTINLYGFSLKSAFLTRRLKWGSDLSMMHVDADHCTPHSLRLIFWLSVILLDILDMTELIIATPDGHACSSVVLVCRICYIPRTTWIMKKIMLVLFKTSLVRPSSHTLLIFYCCSFWLRDEAANSLTPFSLPVFTGEREKLMREGEKIHTWTHPNSLARTHPHTLNPEYLHALTLRACLDSELVHGKLQYKPTAC